MISLTDYCVLLELDDRWKWIIRDEHSQAFVSEDKPSSYHGTWDNGDGEWMYVEDGDFDCIGWLDEEPHYVPDLIKEYEARDVERSSTLNNSKESEAIISNLEYEVLEGLDDKFKWLARDGNGKLWTYEKRPCFINHSDYWYSLDGEEKQVQGGYFTFIGSGNGEVAYYIPDLIDDYKSKNKDKKGKVVVPLWFDRFVKNIDEAYFSTSDMILALSEIYNGSSEYGLGDKQRQFIEDNLPELTQAILSGYEVREQDGYEIPLSGSHQLAKNSLGNVFIYCIEQHADEEDIDFKITREDFDKYMSDVWESRY